MTESDRAADTILDWISRTETAWVGEHEGSLVAGDQWGENMSARSVQADNAVKLLSKMRAAGMIGGGE